MHLLTNFLNFLQGRRLGLGFVVAVLLVGFGFFMSLYSHSRSQEDNQRITHTFLVINQLGDVLSLIKDMETGSRGYMASGDRLFLESYYTAQPRLKPQLARLKRLVSDSPQQQQAADTLVQLVEVKLTITQQQIKLPRNAPDTLRRTYLKAGKASMDQVRGQVARMIAREQGLIEQRNVAARRSFQNTLVIISALSALTFIVLITLYRLLELELKQRSENEAQLRAYERELEAKIGQLEISNQELERMAFVASHDMQEPLRKIRAFGDLLMEHLGPTLAGDGRLFLEKIIGSAGRMSMLIRDLLNFSRLTNRREPFVPTNLNELVDRLLADLDLTIRETGATISRSPLPTIDAIPSQLEQLLTNLLTNALKYMAPGKQPVVRIAAEATTGATYPGLQPEDPYVRLTISDNGIGFDEKYLDRIFEIFQRLHAKSQYEGTGIGLAICKRVVVHHNGYITAQSREGVGTTFIIVLPVKQAETLTSAVVETIVGAS